MERDRSIYGLWLKFLTFSDFMKSSDHVNMVRVLEGVVQVRALNLMLLFFVFVKSNLGEMCRSSAVPIP